MAKKKTQRELAEMHEKKAAYYTARSEHFRAMALVSKGRAEQIRNEAREVADSLGSE